MRIERHVCVYLKRALGENREVYLGLSQEGTR